MTRGRKASESRAIASLLSRTPTQYLRCRKKRRHAFDETGILLDRKRGMRILEIEQYCPCGTKRWDRYRVRLEEDLRTLHMIERLGPVYKYPPDYLRAADDPLPLPEDYDFEWVSRLATDAGLVLAS